MSWMLTPSSRASLRAAGAAGIDALSGTAGFGRVISTTCAGRFCDAADSGACDAGTPRVSAAGEEDGAGLGVGVWTEGVVTEAGAAATDSTTKIVCPTLIFSPAFTLASLTTPSADEGISMLALSVSTSRTG